jgi:hypothetical protein
MLLYFLFYLNDIDFVGFSCIKIVLYYFRCHNFLFPFSLFVFLVTINIFYVVCYSDVVRGKVCQQLLQNLISSLFYIHW